MTVSEAHERWSECLGHIEELSSAFPCENCDGHGELYPGGCYHACDECNGFGFVLPEEEDE